VSTLRELLRELVEGEVPGGPVTTEPYPGALEYGLKQLDKKDRNRFRKRKRAALRLAGFAEAIGQEGFPEKLATRGVKEMNVLTRGLKYRAVELDKKSEVLKHTGGVTMKQQAWLDRNVLHPVTRVNNQLDMINAKLRKTFFEDALIDLCRLIEE
jgi:hypothetical protein